MYRSVEETDTTIEQFKFELIYKSSSRIYHMANQVSYIRRWEITPLDL